MSHQERDTGTGVVAFVERAVNFTASAWVLVGFLTGIGAAIWGTLSGLAPIVNAVLGLFAFASVLGIIVGALHIGDRFKRKQSPEISSAASNTQIVSQVSKPKLEVRFSSSAPYSYSDGQIIRYRIGAHNPGPTTIENVRMELLSITPQPKAGNFSADFPYPVRRVTDQEPKDYERINADGKSLSPDAEELFEPLWFWLSSDNRVMLDGMDTKPIQWKGRFEMQEHESWCLRYRISSGHATAQIAVFMVRREGAHVVMERIPC